ncbi:MAG: hypothetical protein ACREPU_05735 [Rhodanobacteraceae bacterium]
MRFKHAGMTRLRGLGLVALACLVLAGCATAPAAPGIEHLTTQHYAPTQTVDVLISIPDRPFVRIARLTLGDPTGSATRAQLIAQLSSTAQNLGADAIVVEGVAQSGGAGIGFNPSGGQMQDSGNQAPLTVSVLAIRYTH